MSPDAHKSTGESYICGSQIEYGCLDPRAQILRENLLSSGGEKKYQGGFSNRIYEKKMALVFIAVIHRYYLTSIRFLCEGVKIKKHTYLKIFPAVQYNLI